MLIGSHASAHALALWLGAAALSASGGAQAQARGPANTPEELWPALTRCWRPPAGSEGSEVTVAFSLNRSGEIISRPTIVDSKLTGNDDAQRAFVGSVLAGVAQCTPVAITEQLGAIIGGRLVTLRFGARQRPTPST